MKKNKIVTGISFIVFCSILFTLHAKALSVVDEVYDTINMVGKYEMTFAVGSNTYGFCQGNNPFDIYGQNCNDVVRLPGDTGGRITATDKNGKLLGFGGNSSSSVLTKPSSNAKVVRAYLMQQAYVEEGRESVLVDYAMTLKGPKGNSIKPKASKVFVSDRNLNSIGVTYVDVTEFVKQQGFGKYEGWDIPYVTRGKWHDADNYASWRLIVICEDPDLPIRMLRMKMGSGSTTGKTITLQLDGAGFVTKSSGNVSGQIIIGGGGGDVDVKSSTFDFKPSANSPTTQLTTGSTGDMNRADGFLQAIVTHNGVPRSDVRALGYRLSDHSPVHNTDLILMDVNSTQSNAKNGHNAYFVNNSNQITLSAITGNGYKGNLDLFGILADIDSATYSSSLSHSEILYKNTDITMKARIVNNTQVNKPSLGVSGGYGLITVDNDLVLDLDNITAVYTHNGVKTTLPKSMITVNGNTIKVMFGANLQGKSYRGDSLEVTFHGSTTSEVSIENNVVMHAPSWIDETGNAHEFGSLTTMTSAKDSFTIKHNDPPTINAIDRIYYDSEYTQKEWMEQLRMQGVTATDKEDGGLTSKIIVISDNVDMDKQGRYQVIYQVTDSVKNTTNKSILVTIKHNDPPVINVTDKTFYSDDYTKEEWKNIIRMQNVTATDKEDGNLTSDIEVLDDLVDPTIAGNYLITYQVTDSHNKTTLKTINVEVLYNHAPVINASSFKFYENEYSDEKWKTEFMKQVTADDYEDGDLTDNVTIKSTNVNPQKPGAYEVIMSVTDIRGKTTEKTVDVTVLENRQPNIQIFAESKRFVEGEYTIDEWHNVRMQKVTAYDAEDNDITDDIQVKSDSTIVDVPGKYKVTYKVTDRYGKTAEKDALVTVIPNLPPEIYTSDKWFTTNDKITDEDLLKNVLSIDDHDGDISDKVTIKQSDVKVGKAGNYNVTYSVSDRFGKFTDKTIVVHITESSGISIKPNPPITFDPDALGIWNNQSKGMINVTKLMETSIFENDSSIYNDVVFGVYSAEDITYKGIVILQKDSLVAIAKPNIFGQVYAIVHHQGKYYLRELETNDNYVLNDRKFYFTFKCYDSLE